MTAFDEHEEVILWQDQPAGIWDRVKSFFHINFTSYHITKDELCITTGFFSRRHNTYELYTLKDPDLEESFIQRMLKIGTIRLSPDMHIDRDTDRDPVRIKNIKNADKVRKLLRDLIEENVKERGITYYDRV